MVINNCSKYEIEYIFVLRVVIGKCFFDFMYLVCFFVNFEILLVIFFFIGNFDLFLDILFLIFWLGCIFGGIVGVICIFFLMGFLCFCLFFYYLGIGVRI